jgi:hypothetical protein
LSDARDTGAEVTAASIRIQLVETREHEKIFGVPNEHVNYSSVISWGRRGTSIELERETGLRVMVSVTRGDTAH